MSLLLTLAPNDLKRLCAIASTDTSQDAALTALLAAEQPAQEYALDPGLLGLAVTLAAPVAPALVGLPVYPGLLSTLTLGVAEVLAGSFLRSLGRFPHFAEPLPLSSLTAQAAAVLTVATSDVKRLLSIDPGDTSQDTAIAAQIAAEQLALEYALDPAVLAAAVSTATPNAGLKAWLTLGVGEQIAGHYLEQSGRVPGLGVDIQVTGLHVSTSHAPSPDKLGSELSAQGTARLLPFSRHIRAEHGLKPVLNQPDLVKLGTEMTAQGRERLAPYTRAARARAGAPYEAAPPGTVPDDDAPIPQIIVAATPEPSVFDRAFADVGDQPWAGDADALILWDTPEP